MKPEERKPMHRRSNHFHYTNPSSQSYNMYNILEEEIDMVAAEEPTSDVSHPQSSHTSPLKKFDQGFATVVETLSRLGSSNTALEFSQEPKFPTHICIQGSEECLKEGKFELSKGTVANPTIQPSQTIQKKGKIEEGKSGGSNKVSATTKKKSTVKKRKTTP